MCGRYLDFRPPQNGTFLRKFSIFHNLSVVFLAISQGYQKPPPPKRNVVNIFLERKEQKNFLPNKTSQVSKNMDFRRFEIPFSKENSVWGGSAWLSEYVFATSPMMVDPLHLGRGYFDFQSLPTPVGDFSKYEILFLQLFPLASLALNFYPH